MSRFTGKCDFCDECDMIHSRRFFVKKADIYLGDAKVEIKNEKDLLPYFTHITSSAGYTKRHATVHLSSNSWIDLEEIQSISWRVRDMIDLYKRNKKEFSMDFALNHLDEFNSRDKPAMYMIIKIILEHPEYAKIPYSEELYENYLIPYCFSEVHTASYTERRKEFLEFLGQNGYAVKNGDEGKYHPIIFSFRLDVFSYERAVELYNNYKEGKNNEQI